VENNVNIKSKLLLIICASHG